MEQQHYGQQPAQQAVPVQQPQAVAAQPPAASNGPAVPNMIIPSPTWVFIVRIFQIILSIIITGLCGWLMHGAYADAQGLAVAVSVLTWAIVAYIVLTEKMRALNSLYHIAAVLALDAFLIIMWLAAMGANAHHRSRFRYAANISGCYDDGSSFDSTICWRKRSLDRDYYASQTGLIIMIIISLLCAIEFVLFAVVFGITLRTYLQQRKSAAPLAAATDAEKQSGIPLQTQPAYNQFQAAPAYQPQPQQQLPVQPVQPQYTGGTYPSPQPQPAYPAQQPIQPQYTGGQQYAAAATPPPGHPVHEAPGQPMMVQQQYTGGTAYTPSPQTTGAPTYAQELPGQYDQARGAVSPPGSPPPQQGYGHPPQ